MEDKIENQVENKLSESLVEKGEKNMTNIQELNELFKEIYASEYVNKITRLDRDIHTHERDLKHAMDRVGYYSRRMKEMMIELEALKSKTEEKDFTTDIESLLNHKLVENIEIDTDNNLVYVFTDYIDIYDEDENRYKGNKYRIRFNFEAIAVKIYGLDENYCRKSYWSNIDPHPHVSGDTGTPCLGDAGPMLASTLSDHELYASFIITLNFLQQVNTNDPAGKFIKNWDCIDDENNILENPHASEEYVCYRCDYSSDSDEDFEECYQCGELVCSDCRSWSEDKQSYICEYCADSYYFWCAHCNELCHEESLRTTINDESICAWCAEDQYTMCDKCEMYVKDDEATYFEPTGEYYCSECHGEVKAEYEECYECGELTYKEDSTWCEDIGHSLCDICVNDSYFYCQDCGELKHRDYLRETIRDSHICSTCAEDHYTFCEECERYAKDSEAKYFEPTEEHYCEDCYEDIKEQYEEDQTSTEGTL